MDRGLHNEHDYDLESAERWAHRLTRRQVLRAGAMTAGAAAVGPTLAQSLTSRAHADVPGIVKPTPDSLFVARGTNAEMRWSAMRGQGYLTPIDRFFVRNHTSTPRIDPTTWRLRVHGTGVERELSVSYDDLLALPQISLTRFIECAGNGRSFFAHPAGPSGGRDGLDAGRRRRRRVDRHPAVLRAGAGRHQTERAGRDAGRAGRPAGAPTGAAGEGACRRHAARAGHERSHPAT